MTVVYTCPACGYKQDQYGCTGTVCGFFEDTLASLLDYYEEDE